MSGIVITYKITQPFGDPTDATNITLPIPVPPTGIGAPNRASFSTGFPDICFLTIANGGIPPSGKDFNGMYYMLSQYAAALQAGQAIVGYDAATQTAISGYAVGAVLQQAANPLAFWINGVAGNVTDPDTGGAGWMSTVAIYSALAGTPGNNNDFVLPGLSDYVLDVNPASGSLTYTGFVAQRDGQKLTIVNTGASNTITVASLNGASAAANRIRLIGDTVLGLQNASITLQYVKALALWIQA